MTDQDKTKHLCNRAGFGCSPSNKGKEVKSFFGKSDPLIEVIPKPELPDNPSGKMQFKDIFQKSRENLMKLNLAWLEKLRTTEDPLREKMVLFWHNHFSCRTLIPYLAQQQNNLLRKHALGNFADMLLEISKDPAMLQFLNNQQNRKGHPNENFAREVMELFTLGRGNYTETDIKEAARAFTGWGFNAKGEYQFREKLHDFESKTFRGQTKNFTGEDIISSILEDKQMARFITQKIIAFFVSQENLPSTLIDDCAQSFYKSGYDIGKLMKEIFSSDWFYKSEFVGNRIKTPIELIIGIQHQTESQFADLQSLIFFQRALGQLLFFPPNVGGWPRGKQWIDSSSLTFRMAVPRLVFHKQETEFQAKEDGDVNSLREKKPKRDFSLNVDWATLATRFRDGAESAFEQAENYLLSRPTSAENKKVILKLSAGAKDEADLIKKIFTGVMSLPEYQLC
ncbi:MAG: DUF1800 domain-containing protein [Bacteroidetes bacterium]|nr:DUF1800 domain-containing protein [Bacteroidota bacterium]MBI3483443.1 DUF1800 domain-containing protein [Bacteroidota bacterium]